MIYNSLNSQSASLVSAVGIPDPDYDPGKHIWTGKGQTENQAFATAFIVIAMLIVFAGILAGLWLRWVLGIK